MLRFKKAQRIVVASVLLGGGFGATESQTADKQRPSTSADMAKAPAQELVSIYVRSSTGALLKPHITSRGNVIMMKFIVDDFSEFDRLKSNSNKTRELFVTYWCSESRVAALQQGVVIHATFTRSDNKDRVETTIDKSSCTNR